MFMVGHFQVCWLMARTITIGDGTAAGGIVESAVGCAHPNAIALNLFR
jgi:hypothetical protein